MRGSVQLRVHLRHVTYQATIPLPRGKMMNIDLNAPLAIRIPDYLGGKVTKCYVTESKHEPNMFVVEYSHGVYRTHRSTLMDSIIAVWHTPTFEHWELLDDDVVSITRLPDGRWIARTKEGRTTPLVINAKLLPTVQFDTTFALFTIKRPHDK